MDFDNALAGDDGFNMTEDTFVYQPADSVVDMPASDYDYTPNDLPGAVQSAITRLTSKGVDSFISEKIDRSHNAQPTYGANRFANTTNNQDTNTFQRKIMFAAIGVAAFIFASALGLSFARK